jgi:VIT1/CCC1 family predicted Fe2+/Mn2+ transporter
VDLRPALAAHLRSRQVSRVLYGTVVGLALVVGLEDHPPASGVMVGTVLATAVAVGLAELYSEYIGRELQSQRLGVGARTLRRISAEALATMAGTGFPAVFFILAAAGALSTSSAFTVAKWSGLGLIAAYGFVAGRLSGAPVRTALLHAGLVGAVGGLLILVKSLLH